MVPTILRSTILIQRCLTLTDLTLERNGIALVYSVRMAERETDRQTDRQRERDRERETDRQTDRQRQLRERDTHRQSDRQTGIQINRKK